MKINPQLPLAIPTVLTNPQHDNFADWLQSPTHDSNGDEYYRLHQHQLQPSALSFKAIITHQSQKHVSDEPSLAIANSQSPLSPLNTALIPDIKPQETWQVIQDDISITHPDPKMTEHISTLKTTMTACLTHFDTPIMPESLSHRPNAAISDKSRQYPTAITPTYQLFLNGNEAELALNTQQLSKQDAEDLHTLIKQELAAKGYRLSKLIINGVTQ